MATDRPEVAKMGDDTGAGEEVGAATVRRGEQRRTAVVATSVGRVIFMLVELKEERRCGDTGLERSVLLRACHCEESR